jgi:hypothetical protein
VSEEPLVFGNQQGRPALISGNVECIHNVSPRPASITFRALEQIPHEIWKDWFQPRNYAIILDLDGMKRRTARKTE